MLPLPLRRAWRARPAAASLVVAVLGAGACLHPWDDYEAFETTDTSTGTGGSPSPLCTELCNAYEDCIGPDADCLGQCASLLANCSSEELGDLADCVAQLESCAVPAVAEAVWNACLLQVGCYVP